MNLPFARFSRARLVLSGAAVGSLLSLGAVSAFADPGSSSAPSALLTPQAIVPGLAVEPHSAVQGSNGNSGQASSGPAKPAIGRPPQSGPVDSIAYGKGGGIAPYGCQGDITKAISGAVILISVAVNARSERRAGRQILERQGAAA